MRIKQLEYLIALKQYGSFLKTSQEIFVAQPAISAAIRDLEEELGYTLLNRNHKGVEFTEKGEQVLEKSRAVTELLNEIRALKYDSQEKLEGTLRIGCGSRFCGAMVIDAYTVLHKRYPEFNMNIKRKSAMDVLRLLEMKEIDLGLIQIDTIEEEAIRKEIAIKGFASEELFRDEMVFVVSSHHPLRGRKRVSLKELMKYPYVTAKASIHPAVERLFRDNGYEGAFIQIDDIAGMRHFLEQSDAVTYMTKSAMRNDNEIYNNNFSSMTITDFDWWCSIEWVHHKATLDILEQIIMDELNTWKKQYM